MLALKTMGDLILCTKYFSSFFLVRQVTLVTVKAWIQYCKMAALDSLAELNSILEQWNTENAAAGFATSDPIPKLKRLIKVNACTRVFPAYHYPWNLQQNQTEWCLLLASSGTHIFTDRSLLKLVVFVLQQTQWLHHCLSNCLPSNFHA